MSLDTSNSPENTNWYLAFAEWRIERYFVNPRKSVRFFRQSHIHALIWALAMRGYYTGTPPSFKDCIRTATCATETARKIVFDAVSRGFFVLAPAIDDGRKKLIRPSQQCIAEYESHVGMFLKFPEVLCPATTDGCVE